MNMYESEAFAFWRASKAAHAAFYDGSADPDAIDDLDVIAQQSVRDVVKSRCRSTVVRLTHQALTAVASA